jgi:hypothetical protein
MQQDPDETLIAAIDACDAALENLTAKSRGKVLAFLISSYIAEHPAPSRDHLMGQHIRLVQVTLARFKRERRLIMADLDA